MKRFIVLILSVLFVMTLFAGCSNDAGNFEPKNYTQEDTQIKGVAIDVQDREIQVSLSSDALIHIDYFESDKEYYDLFVSDDGILTMTSENNKEWTDYFGGSTPSEVNRISLQVPESLLSSLTLRTSKEDITLPSLHIADEISLSNNGGDILFDKLDVGNLLSLENKNGDIRGTILGGYDDYHISCEIKKGDSNLPAEKPGGEKSLNVTNNNGDIEIQFAQE